MPPEAPLKILVIAPTPFFADRGCHVRIYEQCRELHRRGHEATVCTYHLGRDVGDVEIRRSLRVPWYRKLSAGPSVHKFYLDALLLLTVLRQCARRRPDIIHAHLHEGIVIGKIASILTGAPLVADVQGSLTGELLQHGFMKEGGLLHGLLERAERFITRLPRMVIASSAGTLASLPGGSAIDGARVVADTGGGEGFAFDEEGRRRVREQLKLEPGHVVIGYLGVLTEYQGVSVLLRAARRVAHQHEQARFLIMGYPDVERYRAMAAKLGIAERVVLTGRVPYDEAGAYLSACDVAVSPKLSTTEANGKLLNYLAVGLPVVASNTPINREILGDAAVLTPPGDDEALAEALAHLVSDWRAAEALARQVRRRAAELCTSSLGEQLEEIYEEVRRPGPRSAKTPEGVHAVQTP